MLVFFHPNAEFLQQGEALRLILVNRYYGNVKPGQRRESLTSYSNGPLTPGAQGKSPTRELNIMGGWMKTDQVCDATGT